jgi:hypothetical protein
VTTERLKITRQRGGDHHPLPTKAFIIQYLYINGEGTVSDVHIAYKNELKALALKKGNRRPYHWARYASFKRKMLGLVSEGIIEYTGRDEESQEARFEYWPEKPKMRVYRLTAAGISGDLLFSEEGLTRKLASDLTDGHGTDTENLGELPKVKVSTDGQQPVKRSTNRRKR